MMKIKTLLLVASLALAVTNYTVHAQPTAGYGKSREQAAPVPRAKSVYGLGKTPEAAESKAKSRLNAYSNVQITRVFKTGNPQTGYQCSIEFTSY